MNTDTTQVVTDQANTVGQSWWSVFEAWAFTPTGAVLLLIVIFFGGAGGILSMLGRPVKWVMTAAKAAAALFFFWVVGGILEAWGLPVKETLDVIFGWVPAIANGFGQFVLSLFKAAS